VVFPLQPEIGTAPDLTWDDLEYLVHNNNLPNTGLLSPSTLDVVTVASNVELTSSPAPLLTVAAVPIRAVAGTSVSPASAGCVEVAALDGASRPVVQLAFSEPASVSIHAAVAASLSVRLFASSSPTVGSEPRAFAVDGAANLYLDVSFPGVALVQLPAGGATLCGVAP
jgi:hypothetical protein